jgi:uncharacterized FlgJ-related protein
MKEQIYQNGFYLLIGLLVGCFTMSMYDNQPEVQVKVIKDTIKVTDTIQKKVAKLELKELNETNVRKELKKHKIPHSDIVLAQAKLESNNFKSKLTKTHNNIFGMKTGNHYTKYAHWSDCIADYKKRISNRYTGGNYYAFLNKINYAEDPNYVNALKEIV